MISKLVVKCYSLVPGGLKKGLGKVSMLKPIRDLLLRQNDYYKEVSGSIRKKYHDYDVSFEFFGSLKNVAQAKKKGIEGTLLRHSMSLLKQYKHHENDCVIFDVGANFGYLSLVWATSVCKNYGNVYAFEPSHYVFSSFSKSVANNSLSHIIKPEHMAVGNANKQMTLYLNNTTSNILNTNASSQSIEVEMRTLDTYILEHAIKRCDLVKIDVDGIELDILKGSLKLLKTLKPIFIVETNNDYRIIEFFNSQAYTILDMNLKIYKSGQALPINVLCVPN